MPETSSVPKPVRASLSRCLAYLAGGHVVLAAAFALALVGVGALFMHVDARLTDELATTAGATTDAVRLALTMESLKTPRFLEALGMTAGGTVVGLAAAAWVYAMLAAAYRRDGAKRLAPGRLLAAGIGSYAALALARATATLYVWGDHLELFDDSGIVRALLASDGWFTRFFDGLGYVGGIALTCAVIAFALGLSVHSSRDRMAMKAS